MTSLSILQRADTSVFEEPRLADAFRHAMRRHAATVAILSVLHEGRRYGVTISSLASLSLEPPLLSLALARRSRMLPQLLASGIFCVNLPSSGQERHARACAGALPPEERLADPAWQEGFKGLPRLAGAQAWIYCRLLEAMHFATHCLIIGEVQRAETCGPLSPLLYLDGAYRVLPREKAA